VLGQKIPIIPFPILCIPNIFTDFPEPVEGYINMYAEKQ
jgi:hypothetical protein